MGKATTKEQSDIARVLIGHTDGVVGVAVTPDGTCAVSASGDKTLRVWDLAARLPAATLKGHSSTVYGVAVTPDGTRAVSAAGDDTLLVWDLATGRPVSTLRHTDAV